MFLYNREHALCSHEIPVFSASKQKALIIFITLNSIDDFCVYIWGGGPHWAAYGVPRPGIRSKPQFQPWPQLGNTTSLTHCAGWELNLHLSTPKTRQILLCHSRNSISVYILECSFVTKFTLGK